MEIQRDKYLNKLISKKDNGYIKIITGIRRSGKSYLLFHIYYKYLKGIGVNENQIIKIALDELSNMQYRNPFELDKYIRSLCENQNEKYYIFIDEIQLVSAIQNPYVDDEEAKITFVDVLLGLMKIENLDIYVTGSNSKMLSSDILTQFKDRGDEVRVFPLSYQEFYNAFDKKEEAWMNYFTYGGMPRLLSFHTHEEKSKYLKELFSKTYISDVVERNQISNDIDVLDDLLNIVSSSVGSLTNPNKLSNTFRSVKHVSIGNHTISKYLDYFIDAFVLEKAIRYDVKGKKYIDTPLKYYFTDIGLRNARLNFRQTEENHIMENIIFNELVRREFDVDVGMVEAYTNDEQGKRKRQQLEIDFVASKNSKRYYIQSALTVGLEEKRQQEINSFLKVNDSFKKIVVVKDKMIPWYDDFGILYIGIEQFLLDQNSLDI